MKKCLHGDAQRILIAWKTLFELDECVNKVLALYHIRAYAALMVLFAHGLHNYSRGIYKEIGNWIYSEHIFINLLAECHAGVSLFLVKRLAFGNKKNVLRLAIFLAQNAQHCLKKRLDLFLPWKQFLPKKMFGLSSMNLKAGI